MQRAERIGREQCGQHSDTSPLLAATAAQLVELVEPVRARLQRRVEQLEAARRHECEGMREPLLLEQQAVAHRTPRAARHGAAGDGLGEA